MKCNKCNAEWQVDAGRSASITICPFCQEKIVTEKSGDWQYFDNTKELLAYVAAEYGLDALFGRKYFSDHTSPMMPQGQKNLVKQAFDCGAVKILQDNINSDQQHKEIAVKQAAGKLIDTYASAKDAAERVIWEFTNAIGWGLPEPQGLIQPSGTTQGTSGNAKPATPPPPPPQSSGIDSLMQLAAISLQNGDWQEAEDYYKDVLKQSPQYAPAWVGRLCVDLKLSKEDKLAAYSDPNTLINHKFFQTAMQFADPTIKTRLDSYIQTINARIDAEQKAAAAEAERRRKAAEEAAEEAARRKHVQDAFNNADKLMRNAQSLDDYRKAITAFDNIDSNYQDINNQIKSKIAECEWKMQQIAVELDKVLAPLREKLDPKAKAEKQAKLQKQHKADLERLNAENTQTKAEVEAKCAQIKQTFESDHAAWQEAYSRLKAGYDAEYRKWETAVNEIKVQAENRKSQGLCPHCGGTLKGLLTKKCSDCGKAPSELVITPLLPTPPKYPDEPQLPQMPAYTPKTLDESRYVLKEDSNSVVNQRITLAGIEWRILDVQGGKLLLISEKILENRPYNVEPKDITWESCTLRKYLNSEFYNKLGAAKLAIAETRNSNPNNPWHGTNGGNTTTDKVFLLNLDELVKYFGDSGDLRNKKRKDYNGKSDSSGHYVHDQYNSARVANYGSEASRWCLRSPGCFSRRAAGVDSGGIVTVDGYSVTGGIGGVGVRPALWLNL